MAVLFHILPKKDWLRSRQAGRYKPASLDSEGFIHCSTPAQIIAVANKWFPGHPDLILLCIDTDRVTAEIRYEDLLDEGRLFPHIYGTLEVSTVIDFADFPPNPDGTFTLPKRFAAIK